MPLQNDFESSIKNITVDLADSGVPRATLMAMQGDKGTRFARITVLNGGHPVDLTNVYAVLRGVKKDGTTIFNGCEIENNKIIAELTQNILSVDGIGRYEIALYSSDPNTVDDQLQVISSFPFTIHVVKSSFDATEMESSNEWTVLNQAMENIPLMAQLDEYVEEVHEALDDMDNIEGSIDDINTTIGGVFSRVEDLERLVDGHTIQEDVPSDAVFTDTTYEDATTSESGLMSYEDKAKLDNIADGAQVNQYAFSRIASGSSYIDAGYETDEVTLVGENITISLTSSGTGKQITFTGQSGGGSTVTDSQINGNIVVDGSELQVYDDSAMATKNYVDTALTSYATQTYVNSQIQAAIIAAINGSY